MNDVQLPTPMISPEPVESRSRSPLASRWLWLGLFGAIVLVSLLAPSTPRIVGLWYDDGIYWQLGKSIQEQGEYRDAHSPEPIRIAKYPPGVPALVALSLTLGGGDLQAALSILRVIYLAAFLGFLSLYLSLLRTERGPTRWVAPILVAAMAVNPWFLDFLFVAMSEIPALFLITFALYRLSRPGSRDSWSEAAILAGICFAAVFVRTMAVAVGMTVFLSFFFGGRRRGALRFAALYGPALALLQLFLSRQARPAPGFEDITVYGRPYLGLLLENLEHVGRVVAINAQQSLLFVAGVCFPGLVEVGYPVDEQFPTLWWVVSVAVALLILIGIVAALRRSREREPEPEEPDSDAAAAMPVRRTPFQPRVRPHQIFLLINLLIILVWPWESYRFWALLAPFLIIELVRGTGAVFGRWGAGVVAVAALAAALIQVVPARLVRSVDAYPLMGVELSVATTLAEVESIAGMLPPGAVVASSRDTFLGAHGNIRGVDGWTNAQLFQKFYGPERMPSTFYMTYHQYTLVSNLFLDVNRVGEEYRRLGVTHAVLLRGIGDSIQGSLLASYVNKLSQVDRADLLHRTDDGAVEVWRIDP